MEGKGREIGNGADHAPMVGGTQRMGGVLAHRHPTKSLLNIGGRMKQVALSLKRRENGSVIARRTAQGGGMACLGSGG